MTDLAANPPDTRAIIQRRLIGLLVLLFIAFLLSLLVRTRSNAPDALPSVVIPLNAAAPIEARTPTSVPTFDVPEPEQPPVLPPAATPVPAAKPVPATQPLARALEPLPRQAQPVVSKSAPAPKPTPPVANKPQPAKPAVTASSKPITPTAAVKPTGPTRWFVAVGAYKDPMAAQAIANRVKLAGFNAGTSPTSSGAERLHRVRAGPFAAKDEAESARVTLIVDGLTKAVVVSEK